MSGLTMSEAMGLADLFVEICLTSRIVAANPEAQERQETIVAAILGQALPPMRVAAKKYRRLWGVKGMTAEDAVHEGVLVFLKWVQAPFADTWPPTNKGILHRFIQLATQPLNTAAHRHAGRPRVSSFAAVEYRIGATTAPSDEVDGNEFIAYVIEKVRGTKGEESAECLRLRTLGYSLIDIATNLDRSLRTVSRRLAAAEEVARILL